MTGACTGGEPVVDATGGNPPPGAPTGYHAAPCPSGKLLFIEHVRGDGRRGRLQFVVRPVVVGTATV
ncbi:MAG TPA: hypothetical protein VKB70_05735 [Gaiellaceae bacterium]|nr:hypothetical protein [Gaiellaceae bacterium]